MKQKIIIAGGTGFLGQAIIDSFSNTDTEIIVLSRKIHPARTNVIYVQWDAENEGNWQTVLENSTAIINLVGKSVNCRYTEKNKQEIIQSRVKSTLLIARAILTCKNPPKVWINAGSAAIYGDGGNHILTENSPLGDGFPAEVCKFWEEAFFKIPTPMTRKVLFRIGLVFQRNIGLLAPFKNIVKFGLGGKVGSGQQYISWIHQDDFTNIIKLAIERNDFKGIYNASSPEPVTNEVFLKTLRKALNIPFGIPTPAFMLKIGAIFIGTEAELLLKGRRVVSSELQHYDFQFQYNNLNIAFKNLIKK